MRITYVPITPDATGAYRAMWPGRYLAMHGHQILMPKVREYIAPADGRILWEFDVNKAPKPLADIWVIQARWEAIWPEQILHRLRTAGTATVIECDDNYVEIPEWNPAFLGTHPYRSGGVILNRSQRRSKGRRASATAVLESQGIDTKQMSYSQVANYKNSRNREHAFNAMRLADGMVVSTPYLAEVYSQFNKNIKVVRNYLEWDLWANITPQYEVDRERTRIGYLGVFGWRKGDLEILQPFMADFMRRHPDCEFVANSEAVHDFLGIPEDQRVTIGEYMFYQGFGRKYRVAEMTACLDIGLVPLADNALNRGKSHLKGLEYNAAGIPFIATPSESYEWWCDGMNGWLAKNPGEWVEVMEDLVRNAQLRRTMGRHGRTMAFENSLGHKWKKWETAFSEILGDFPTQAARHCVKHGAVQKISELTSLLRIAHSLDPKVVVEVGSARGGTFWGLAQVAHPDALLVSVDIPSGSPLDVREGTDVYSGRDREKMRTYVREGQRCVLIDGNSQLQETVDLLADTLEGKEIDVLFIDADHRYEGVKKDYELYSPLVRSGGLIAFHDVIVQNDRRSGVHILWEELKKEFPENHHEWVGEDNWGLGSWGGIGVIVKP